MYRYFNILSLDVVAGVCVCSTFLGDFLGVNLHWGTVLLLGMCVWLIYTFDHLNDARNIPHEASTERHRFHQRNFNVLTMVCVMILLIAAFFVFIIPLQTLVWGVALSCLVLGYFLLLYLLKLKSSYHKEITIAVLYAGGVLLPAVSISDGTDTFQVIVVFIQFAMLAFTNLVAFAIYETDSDERDYSPSLVRILGVDRAIVLLKLIVVFQILLCLALLGINHFFVLELVLLLMVILLGSIVFYRQFFAKASLYRLVGDAVFVLPLFVLLV
ncbi:hypothetical protein [Fulvivirga kasyanovii]|uniref:Ubiquinone biosynthesis protein UbiA n=1 Tax=Fulvivirga kasyanovii TaxID=396812 RepID=A0ABW9RRU9_9BACT|nr:hypothetical protein [Fulvivirga kasyanovii]MTI26457.1 hypothetical protein [Fulvivirga kasyanovii]